MNHYSFIGILLFAAALKWLFWYSEKPGKLGWFGKRVRFSNHASWEDAVEEQKKKIASLEEKINKWSRNPHIAEACLWDSRREVQEERRWLGEIIKAEPFNEK